MARQTGTYQKIGTLEYFTPEALPPKKPAFEMNGEMLDLYGQAMHYIGQLDEMSSRLPDVERFIKAYAIKEAIKSSEIEGIHSTIVDIYTQPTSDKKPAKQTQLVLNYSKAMESALKCISNEGLPISGRVLLKAHSALLGGGTGDKSDPGAYRKQPVKVGNFTPPPAQKIPDLMADLEKFINGYHGLPPLIKAGLVHVQFETIHPFLDGNGRVGRLLIVLMLIEAKLLESPIIYPSAYFKQEHMLYYKKLDDVRLKGEFEGWIEFFLKGIIYSAKDAWQRAKDVEALEFKVEEHIDSSEFSLHRKKVLKEVLGYLFKMPVISIKDIAQRFSKSFNAAAKIVDELVVLNILHTVENQKRYRVYSFDIYLQLLEKEYSGE